MTFTAALCIKPFSSNHLRRCRQIKDDPSSPKVGCMGQVRRCKAAEKTRAPRPPLPTLPPTAHSGKRHLYFVMASVAFLVSPMNVGRCARKARPALRERRVVAVDEIEAPLPVAVEELDPPLPVAAVEKKEKEIEAPALSLWKRRCRSRKLEELFCRQDKLPVAVAGLAV